MFESVELSFGFAFGAQKWVFIYDSDVLPVLVSVTPDEDIYI